MRRPGRRARRSRLCVVCTPNPDIRTAYGYYSPVYLRSGHPPPSWTAWCARASDCRRRLGPDIGCVDLVTSREGSGSSPTQPAMRPAGQHLIRGFGAKRGWGRTANRSVRRSGGVSWRTPGGACSVRPVGGSGRCPRARAPRDTRLVRTSGADGCRTGRNERRTTVRRAAVAARASVADGPHVFGSAMSPGATSVDPASV